MTPSLALRVGVASGRGQYNWVVPEFGAGRAKTSRPARRERRAEDADSDAIFELREAGIAVGLTQRPILA